MSAPVVSRARLAAIQLVGLVNLAFGGLYVALGLWILLSGADSVVNLVQARQEISQAAAQVPVLVDTKAAKTGGDILDAASKGLGGFIMAVASIFAGCAIVQGLPLVLVGAGVLLRQRRARVFALFFAALALLEGAGCLASKNSTRVLLLIGGVLVGYGVISFVALLGRGASDFFARAMRRRPASRSRAAGHWRRRPAYWCCSLPVWSPADGIWVGQRRRCRARLPTKGRRQTGQRRTGRRSCRSTIGRPEYKLRVAALMDAIEHGETSRVQALIKDGVGVDDLDAHDQTPLMKAVQAGHAHLLPVLIAKGADHDVRDQEGNDLFLSRGARQGQVGRRRHPLPRLHLDPSFTRAVATIGGPSSCMMRTTRK